MELVKNALQAVNVEWTETRHKEALAKYLDCQASIDAIAELADGTCMGLAWREQPKYRYHTLTIRSQTWQGAGLTEIDKIRAARAYGCNNVWPITPTYHVQVYGEQTLAALYMVRTSDVVRGCDPDLRGRTWYQQQNGQDGAMLYCLDVDELYEAGLLTLPGMWAYEAEGESFSGMAGSRESLYRGGWYRLPAATDPATLRWLARMEASA